MDKRDWIIAIIFCLILTAGAFGWGYIWHDRTIAPLREDVKTLERKATDHEGRIVAIESGKKH